MKKAAARGGFMRTRCVGQDVARHARIQLNGHAVHVMGTVQGYVPDGQAVAEAVGEDRPAVVALGVPPEDLVGLQQLAASDEPGSLIGRPPPVVRGAAAPAAGAPGFEGIQRLGSPGDAPRGDDDDAPFDSLDPLSQRFLHLLEAHGEVRLPSPDLQAAYAWALEHGSRVEALDLDDEAHAEVYIRANRFRDVWRSGQINKRLAKATFDVTDAESLALEWDTFQNRMPSLQAVEAAREIHMARRLSEVATGPTLAIVPLARLEGVVARLEGAVPSPGQTDLS